MTKKPKLRTSTYVLAAVAAAVASFTVAAAATWTILQPTLKHQAQQARQERSSRGYVGPTAADRVADIWLANGVPHERDPEDGSHGSVALAVEPVPGLHALVLDGASWAPSELCTTWRGMSSSVEKPVTFEA